MRLFGTAGMRGLTGIEMSPELFRAAAGASAEVLGAKGGTVALGRDTRPGAAMLAAAAMTGLLESGADVLDAGVIPTPGLVHAITARSLAGGIMVTGSHLPPERSGMMVLRSDGAYITDDGARKLESLLGLEGHAVEPGSYGELRAAPEAAGEYRRWLLSSVDLGAIREKRFRVAVDGACGTAAGLVSAALRAAWCDVRAVNDEPGPDPGRDPEPRASSLGAVADLVRSEGLDLGVAFDADADRVAFIDSDGRYVSEDAAGGLLGLATLPAEGGVMVAPVNSSGMADWLAASRGAALHHCRIGQPAIVAMVKETGAHFAYEESGKYFFPGLSLGSDGPLACLRMLELLAAGDEPLSARVSALPTFHQVKRKLDLPGGDPVEFMDRLRSAWEGWEPFPSPRRDLTDGLKLLDSDGSWLLIRPSGTEPVLRVFSDSPDREKAGSLADAGVGLVNDLIAADAGETYLNGKKG